MIVPTISRQIKFLSTLVLETGEIGDSILDFLENQMDKTKKLILIVLRFKGLVTEFVDKFLISIDTKERWELDVAVNKVFGGVLQQIISCS